MALATFSDLKAKVLATPGYDDQTSNVTDFITLAEARIQVDAKLVEFETSASVTVTAGTGALPTGFVGMRSVYWNDDSDQPLRFIPPEQFDALQVNQDTPRYYTVTGSSLKVVPYDTGSAVCTYSARFTSLSDAAPTNAVLTNFPDVYLFGTLLQAAIYTKDDTDMQKYGLLFNAAIERINRNNEDRKYAGSTLQVRAR